SGADINANNQYAFILACRNGYFGIVQYLTKNGSDTRIDNDYALRVASEYGSLTIVNYLVKNKTDIHANGGDAWNWASVNGHIGVIKYLGDLGLSNYSPKPISRKQPSRRLSSWS
ncbi:hypothetical protein BB558_007123, partial [Smittium angustum]